MAGVVAAIVAAGGVLAVMYPEYFREYRLYLTERRLPLDFSFDDLSGRVSEESLKRKFAAQQFRCYKNRAGEYIGDRSCFVDIESHNGASAMSAAFFFADDQLVSASINVPWWAHRKMRQSLLRLYGVPAVHQAKPVAEVRLEGWKLTDGSAVFFNREPSLNPVKWSGVLWKSTSWCEKAGCFLPREYQ